VCLHVLPSHHQLVHVLRYTPSPFLFLHTHIPIGKICVSSRLCRLHLHTYDTHTDVSDIMATYITQGMRAH
jgi:hypothetical protein